VLSRASVGAGSIVERLVARSPERFRPSLQHRYRRRQFQHYVRTRIGGRYRWIDPGIPAPPELVLQTSVMHADDASRAAHPDGYFGGGYLGTLLFLEQLEENGFELGSARSALDFGCGAGKMIRLLRCIQGLRLVGTDVNAAQIEWARANVPGVEFDVNALEPPLPYTAGEFDLVWAASVFTHIPFDVQDAWIAELARVLSPDGFALCTVAGAAHAARQLTQSQRDELAREGRYALRPDEPGVSYASVVTGQLDVFQTREQVTDAFSRHFRVVHYYPDPDGQDDLVLRPL